MLGPILAGYHPPLAARATPIPHFAEPFLVFRLVISSDESLDKIILTFITCHKKWPRVGGARKLMVAAHGLGEGRVAMLAGQCCNDPHLDRLGRDHDGDPVSLPVARLAATCSRRSVVVVRLHAKSLTTSS
jgi:hypothetical protein